MLLDEEDVDLLEHKMYKHNAGYMVISKHVPERYIHRIVLARKIGRKLQKGELCDHINMNKLDNRRENLRVADKSINTINRSMRPDNTTGYIGVYLYWPKEYREKGWAKRWSFRIYRKGHKMHNSKYYKTPEQAHEARINYIKENHPD